MEKLTDGLEIKATTGAAGFSGDDFDAFVATFEDYKRTNDERVQQASARNASAADPLIGEQPGREAMEIGCLGGRDHAVVDVVGVAQRVMVFGHAGVAGAVQQGGIVTHDLGSNLGERCRSHCDDAGDRRDGQPDGECEPPAGPRHSKLTWTAWFVPASAWK